MNLSIGVVAVRINYIKWYSNIWLEYSTEFKVLYAIPTKKYHANLINVPLSFDITKNTRYQRTIIISQQKMEHHHYRQTIDF